jgi:hypothetical protein
VVVAVLGRLLPGRFLMARMMFAMLAAMRIFVARAALLVLLMAWGLDAAEGAAQFFNLALVGQLLALGDFHQFQNFVQAVNHLFERLRNFRGMRHSLADGGSFGGAKIGGLAPLPGLGTALLGVTMAMERTFLLAGLTAAGRGLTGRRRCGRQFRLRLGSGFGLRCRNFLGRDWLAGFFRMRFAEIAGSIALGLARRFLNRGFLG